MKQDTIHQLFLACKLVDAYCNKVGNLDWFEVHEEVELALKKVARDIRTAPKEIQILDQSILPKDRPRLTAQSVKILWLLRLRGDRGVLNTELIAMAGRFSARLHEIRRAGHVVVTKPVGGGVFRYSYIEGPEMPPLVLRRRNNG